MNIFKRKVFLLIIFIFFLSSFLGISYILNDTNKMLYLLENIDKPSTLHSILSNRLYYLSDKVNLGDIILGSLDKAKKHLTDVEIHVLGIIGEEKAFDYLLNECEGQSLDSELSSKMYYVVLSMGMIGDKRFTSILEKMLQSPGYASYGVSKFSIARALYLITGYRFVYVGESGEKIKLYLTEELANARKIVKASMEQNRTYHDMLTLAKLDLPVKWGTMHKR